MAIEEERNDYGRCTALLQRINLDLSTRVCAIQSVPRVRAKDRLGFVWISTPVMPNILDYLRQPFQGVKGKI